MLYMKRYLTAEANPRSISNWRLAAILALRSRSYCETCVAHVYMHTRPYTHSTYDHELIERERERVRERKREKEGERETRREKRE